MLCKNSVRAIFTEMEKIRLNKNKNKQKQNSRSNSKNKNNNREKQRNEENSNDVDLENRNNSKGRVNLNQVEMSYHDALKYLRDNRKIGIKHTRNEQAVECILPNTCFSVKFGTNRLEQEYMNRCLSTIRQSNGNVELNWENLGLREGNEIDLYNLTKDNFKKYEILKDVKPENLYGFDYQRHSMKIKFRNLHFINAGWAKTLEKDISSKYGHIINEMESIIIHGGTKILRKKNIVLLKGIPFTYTYDGNNNLRSLDDIERSLKEILCQTNDIFANNLERVDIIILNPRNERIKMVNHNAKLYFKKEYDVKELYKKNIQIGMVESTLNEWKSKSEMKYDNEPFLFAVMQTCNYCGKCDHEMWGCDEYMPLRKAEEEKISLRIDPNSDEYRKYMRRWRPIPICNVCGDINNPHKYQSQGCNDNMKCINCDSNQHCSRDYKMCEEVIKQMVKINAFLSMKYGADWNNEVTKLQIREEFKTGIGRKHITVEVREKIKLQSRRAESIRGWAGRMTHFLNELKEDIQIGDEKEEMRNEIIKKNNVIIDKSNDEMKNSDINLDNINMEIQRFNDGIQGIMEVPNTDNMKRSVNVNKYKPKQVDETKLKGAMDNFQKFKIAFENDSKEKKKQIEKSKTRHGINRESDGLNNIPSYNKAKVLWKFPVFQRIESGGSIVKMGSSDFDCDALGDMVGVQSKAKDEVNEDENEMANELEMNQNNNGNDTSVRTGRHGA